MKNDFFINPELGDIIYEKKIFEKKFSYCGNKHVQIHLINKQKRIMEFFLFFFPFLFDFFDENCFLILIMFIQILHLFIHLSTDDKTVQPKTHRKHIYCPLIKL